MFFFQKSPSSSPKTIAVCGMEHGIGVTHFSLTLSNYLCSKHRKRTAYVEMNGTNQIVSLAKDVHARQFQFMDIVCYPLAIEEDLPHILSEHFSFIVLDLGVLSEKTHWNFYKCDTKFVIGSVSPWKAAIYYHMLETLLYNVNLQKDHVMVMGNLGIKENKKDFAHMYGLAVKEIPVISNPFQLTTANCAFLQETLATNGINIP